MRLILLSLTLVVPLLGGCASVHGADSNPKHQLPLESIMSGCYGRAADIAGDNLDRPVRPEPTLSDDRFRPRLCKNINLARLKSSRITISQAKLFLLAVNVAGFL